MERRILTCLPHEVTSEGLARSHASPAQVSENPPQKIPAENWADWRWQARHATRSEEALAAHLQLTEREHDGIKRTREKGLPLAITPYYLSLCDSQDPRCPIRLQCVPQSAEAIEVPGDMRDPLGEEAHEVAPYLVQRYPDRALLLVSDRCGVYCRFCTRSRIVGQGNGAVRLEKLAPAFDHIASTPSLREVIISGGDPGLLTDARIAQLLKRLRVIEHINNVRFATRTPVTLPQRVTPDFCQALRNHPSVWLMTHFNHPKELTDESRAACRRLADAGIPVMNQTVLLRGVNDDPEVLSELFRDLVRERVRPYYLLQADPVRGTGHLRTPLSVGVEIMNALQGRLSGIALPKFIVDTPGGRGKVHIAPSPIVEQEAGRTTLRTFRGELVDYIEVQTDDIADRIDRKHR